LTQKRSIITQNTINCYWKYFPLGGMNRERTKVPRIEFYSENAHLYHEKSLNKHPGPVVQSLGLGWPWVTIFTHLFTSKLLLKKTLTDPNKISEEIFSNSQTNFWEICSDFFC
jgi:hypothetical protein